MAVEGELFPCSLTSHLDGDLQPVAGICQGETGHCFPVLLGDDLTLNQGQCYPALLRCCKQIKSYPMSVLVYDATVKFCDRFIHP